MLNDLPPVWCNVRCSVLTACFFLQNEDRTLWEATSTYVEMSPFMSANKIKRPILLIHGEQDNNSGTLTMQVKSYGPRHQLLCTRVSTGHLWTTTPISNVWICFNHKFIGMYNLPCNYICFHVEAVQSIVGITKLTLYQDLGNLICHSRSCVNINVYLPCTSYIVK
jgi:hypothetical protein